jgi:hypothetical protein
MLGCERRRTGRSTGVRGVWGTHMTDPRPVHQAYNTLHRASRCLGERGFALLTGRWRALQRITVSPSRIGELTQAAFVLTQLENGQLRTSC